MLDFRGRLSFLGRLGFCCLLLRVLLRVLRVLVVVSCGFGIATTGLASEALSVVLTYARSTTLLAASASSVVLAYA